MVSNFSCEACPLVNVTLQAVPGKLKLLVKWDPPSSWSDHTLFPLKYQVRYHWDNKGTPHEITFVSSSVCSMELMWLGQSSDWSLPITVTMPAH
uniref:interleukin-27 subunit beta-like n=1 Tax=Oncorhynchus gorbuscha TaxID=8017 RepID=UPI001EAED65B|nr:interleukin-27 subunit beta-like [Oncorhynchus gorbuscha]